MNYIRKILLLFLINSITMRTDSVLSEPKLFTKSVLNGSVTEGSYLREKDSFSTANNGLINFELFPYRSIRVKVYPCTRGTIKTLKKYGSGVILEFSQSGILFCPYQSSIKISSTLKDRTSKVSAKIKNRIITLEGTEANFSLYADNLVFGVNKGSGTINYRGKKVKVPKKYYVESIDGKELSEPILSPLSFLESSKNLGNNKHRACTDSRNKLYSSIGNISIPIGGKRCLDTFVNDTMLVVSPTGLEQRYIFNP